MGKLHQADVRAKIKVGQLIEVLQNHALTDSGELAPTRMKAIEILLRKSMPDLTAMTLSNDPENPVTKPLDIVDVAKKIAFVFALAQDKMKPEGETSAAAERQATTKELRHGLHT